MTDLKNLNQFLLQEAAVLEAAKNLFTALNQEVAAQDRVGLLMPGEFDEESRLIVWPLALQQADTPPEDDEDTLTADDIDCMSMTRLKKLVNEKDIVINSAYDEDDIDDLREAIKDELAIKPEEEEEQDSSFDYYVGVYLWLPPGCPDPVASLYVLIEGKTRRQRWREVKRLQQGLTGRVYLDLPNWDENQLEIKQYPLIGGLDVTTIAAEVVRVANQIAELNKAS